MKGAGKPFTCFRFHAAAGLLLDKCIPIHQVPSHCRELQCRRATMYRAEQQDFTLFDFGLIGSLPAMERETDGMKCRVAPDTAITGNGDNDTPVQPQSERDSVFQREAVAGNGGSRQRTCRG